MYLTVTPTTIQSADGRLVVFAVGADARIYVNIEQCSSCGWTRWTALGNQTFSSRIAAEMRADGRLEIFARGSDSNDNVLYHNWQRCSGGCGWVGWTQVVNDTVEGDPGAVRNADGRLEVFYISHSVVHHTRQICPGCSSWTHWEAIGSQNFITPAVYAARNVDGRVEIFVGNAGIFQKWRVFHAWQTCAGCNTWSNWNAFDLPLLC